MKVKEKVYNEDTRPRFKWHNARQTPVTRNRQMVPSGHRVSQFVPKIRPKNHGGQPQTINYKLQTPN